MGKKNRLAINLVSNVISFIVQLGISFILTPIIAEKVGADAYGFIGLSNNFANYATIFTLIVNSMASRFITLELTKGNVEKANKYYSSVFFMDIIMSIIISIVSVVLICNLSSILDVPDKLLVDVKITFSLVFINLIISVMSTIFTIATYVKNRLDLEAVRNIAGNLLKTICLILLFSIFVPKIYYISIGATVLCLFILIANIKLTKKLTPELKISKKYFDKKSIFTLVKSGIWNLINSLSKVLLTGLDLLISNLFIGSTEMGLLSIAKTIPMVIENFLCTLANIFGPRFVILYSENKKEELIKEVKFSMKLIAYIMIIPVAGFIVLGKDFLILWLSNLSKSDINIIVILSFLSLLPYVFSINNFPLYLLDTATNKLRRPVIATLIMSILSSVTTLLLLKYTKIGIYAVAGTSSIFWILKVIFFNNWNAAKNLEIKWYTFFIPYFKNFLCLIIILIIFYIIKLPLNVISWPILILVAAILAVIGYIISFIFLFNKEEKKSIFNMILKILKLKR